MDFATALTLSSSTTLQYPMSNPFFYLVFDTSCLLFSCCALPLVFCLILRNFHNVILHIDNMHINTYICASGLTGGQEIVRSLTTIAVENLSLLKHDFNQCQHQERGAKKKSSTARDVMRCQKPQIFISVRGSFRPVSIER